MSQIELGDAIGISGSQELGLTVPNQGQVFQYDANGNLLADGTRTYEWDAENRLTAINVGTQRSEFAYDGLGRRIQITELNNGALVTSRHYIWIGDHIVEETDATTAPANEQLPLGSFDAINCSQIVGWAWNPAQPDTPIDVDIYDGSMKIATVLANAFRSDVRAAGAGNGNHGFSFSTPAALKTGTQQTVTVNVGGTTTALGTRTITCSEPSFAGSFDSASCTQLAGWAWDANQPNAAIDVDVYDGGTYLTTVLAGTFRQDLYNAGLGNGDHAFYLPTPPSLKSSSAHTLSLKIGGTQTSVGVTRTLTCPTAEFAGNLDSADCTQIAGWAYDSTQPNAAIDVDIYDGTTLLATIPASTFRQDLENAGIGNGDHGFFYSTPSLYIGSTHSISVHFAGTPTLLPASPKSITCPDETILTRFFPNGLQSAGDNYYYSFDHLGSIREVTDTSGDVIDRYDYDPYGRLTVNEGVTPRFGFTGFYYHPTSSLSLTKYRAYDPNLGRWESRDPLEPLSDFNPYKYVSNDPISQTDPTGLMGRKQSPGVRTRNCDSDEEAECRAICGPRGMESCKMVEHFKVTGVRNNFLVRGWQTGQMSCSCNEDPFWLAERCLNNIKQNLTEFLQWLADHPPGKVAGSAPPALPVLVMP